MNLFLMLLSMYIWKIILGYSKTKQDYNYKNILEEINNNPNIPSSEIIRLDVNRTNFEKDKEINREKISRILKGLSLCCPDVNYSQGMNFIAAFLLNLVGDTSILALKELSESSDNKERFVVLRKIGTDEKMLNQALFRQIGIFFLFPLLLAIIHSIFGMKFISTLLSVLGMNLVNKSTIVTYLFLIIIYGLYFIITYLCSKNIIKER